MSPSNLHVCSSIACFRFVSGKSTTSSQGSTPLHRQIGSNPHIGIAQVYQAKVMHTRKPTMVPDRMHGLTQATTHCSQVIPPQPTRAIGISRINAMPLNLDRISEFIRWPPFYTGKLEKWVDWYMQFTRNQGKFCELFHKIRGFLNRRQGPSIEHKGIVTMTQVVILPDRPLPVSMSSRYVEFSGFQYYRQLC
jgi:hypothetical protein